MQSKIAQIRNYLVDRLNTVINNPRLSKEYKIGQFKKLRKIIIATNDIEEGSNGK